ncbi:protein EMBRYONIC FLOWER 1-like isoform X1 [Papaver somniferum]|uniref:protein EMBRYONIC FLOWER 1-like isoform X1 n=1 Tax=Papaver somniferum TaxID=3469 RepID=UPI000E6F933E|nr:protein EMBRYONIC FLOWER 1-like isoform X1 [Papaver somniferum]XP_026439234.1 protein EMBRYONIC FLOWER 1-like isoform X1 [Papaver somniferum]
MAPNVNIEKNGGCGHFSMRGYCLERRKKDLNACLPFSRMLLPPMRAPDFKYWRCQNCTGIEVGKVPDSHVDAIFPSSAEVAKLSSGLRIASKDSNFGGRKENNGHTPLDLNVDPSLSSCRKETEAVAVNPVGDDSRTCNQCGVNAGDIVNQLTEFSQVVPDINVSLTVDISGSEPGPLEKHGVHSTVYGAAIGFPFANPDIDGSKEISDVGLDARSSKPEGKQNSEICSSNPCTKSDKQLGKVLTDSEVIGVSDVGSHKNEALNPIEDQTDRLYPKEIDEGESDLFGGNDVNIIRNAPRAKDLPSNNIEVSGGTCQKKKAQKVRLMSDILSSGDAVTSCKDSVSDRETIPDNIVTEASHAKGIDLNLDLNNQGCVEGNDKSVVPSNKRKRTKFSQEEDQLPTMMNFAEHAREADAKNASAVDVNSINSRSRLTKHINDGKLTLCQKKQKRSRIEIGQPSSVRQEEAHVEAGAETAPSKPKRNALSRTGLDIDMNKDFSQLQDANSFLMYGPEGISGRDQLLGRDTENCRSPPAKSPYPGFTAGFIQQRLDHNLATNKKAISSKKQNGLPQAKGGGDMREAAISFKFQPREPSGIYSNKSSTVSHGPQNISMTQNDDSIHNASQQAAFDDIPMEIVELMARNQHERRLSGEGSTQNITYSSRTENIKDSSANRTDITDIIGSEMSRMLYEKNSGLRKNSSSNEGNSISSKGSAAIPNKKKSDGFLFPAVSKNRNINFSVSQPTQCAHGSLGFPPFSQNPDQPPRGFPFSARGSSSKNYDQNLSWKEDMLPNNRFSIPLHPSLEAHQMPEKVSGNSSSRKDRHPWSPMVPNSAPFRVNGPEMCVAEPSKSKRPSQCSEPSHRGIFYRDHDLPFVDPSNIHLQKQERNYCNKTKGTNSDLQFLGAGRGDGSHLKKMGPLDMYSSDQTIPAMHLLKLMDAGQNFSKQSPYPAGVHQKDLSSFEKERSKTLMPPPSSRLLNSVEQFPPVLNFGAVASSQKNADSRMITGSKKNNYWETMLSSSSFGAHEDELAKRKNSPTQPTGSKYKSPVSLQNSGKDLSLASGSVPFMGQAKEVGQTKLTNPVAQPRVQGSSSSGKHHTYVTPTFYFVKKPASVSNSMPFKGQPQEIVNPVINVESEVYSTRERNLPVTGYPGPSSINRSERNLPVKEKLGDCSTNRNPADFFAPGPENMYMLSGEDFRRRSPSSEPRSRPSSKPETSNQSPIKRQKTTNPGYPNP